MPNDNPKPSSGGVEEARPNDIIVAVMKYCTCDITARCVFHRALAAYADSIAAPLRRHSEAEYKRGYRDGLEQGIFDGKMDRLRAEHAEKRAEAAEARVKELEPGRTQG